MVDGRPGERPGLGLRRTTSTSTGRPSTAISRGACWCRCSGHPYGAVLERGELVPALRAGARYLRGLVLRPSLSDRSARLSRRCWCLRWRACAQPARGRRLDRRAPGAGAAVAAAAHHGPADAVAVRRRDCAAGKAELAALAASHGALAEAIAQVRCRLQRRARPPESFERLHELLEAQAYRLAYWRVAFDEINYRRFFDVNDLAALRMENAAVFEATHAFILDLAAAGKIDGLRIDHPDGLYDPGRYFEALQERYRQCVAELGAPRAESVPSTSWWRRSPPATSGCRRRWPVSGTTGYRFANIVNGVLVGRQARRPASTGRGAPSSATRRSDFDTRGLPQQARDHARRARRRAHRAHPPRAAHRPRRPPYARLHASTSCAAPSRRSSPASPSTGPTYREAGATAQDRRYIDWAVTRARRESRLADPSVFDFLHGLLLAEPPAGASAGRSRVSRLRDAVPAIHLAGHRQGRRGHQLLSFNRLVSLNDVGGDPDQFGMTVRAFHGASQDRARNWPATMLATSTHDNKRSEDVRARIDVISEMPAAWRLDGAPLESHEPQPQAAGRRRRRAVAQRRVPAVPDADRHAADGRTARSGARGFPRTHPALHGQGRAGGEGPHRLAGGERSLRGGAGRLRGRAPRRRRRAPFSRRSSRAGGGVRVVRRC